jgi:hypothetical protein
LHQSRTHRGNDYTFRVDGESYQIDLEVVSPALRKARVAVQFRLDGSIQVVFKDRRMSAARCQPGDACVAEAPAPVPQPAKRRVYKRGSDWNRDFDLKNAPSLGQILRAEKRAGRLRRFGQHPIRYGGRTRRSSRFLAQGLRSEDSP